MEAAACPRHASRRDATVAIDRTSELLASTDENHPGWPCPRLEIWNGAFLHYLLPGDIRYEDEAFQSKAASIPNPSDGRASTLTELVMRRWKRSACSPRTRNASARCSSSGNRCR